MAVLASLEAHNRSSSSRATAPHRANRGSEIDVGGEARLSAWFDPTEKWLRLETSSWYMKANAILIEVVRSQYLYHSAIPRPARLGSAEPISRLHQRAVPVRLREAAKAVGGASSAPSHTHVTDNDPR